MPTWDYECKFTRKPCVILSVRDQMLGAAKEKDHRLVVGLNQNQGFPGKSQASVRERNVGQMVSHISKKQRVLREKERGMV